MKGHIRQRLPRCRSAGCRVECGSGSGRGQRLAHCSIYVLIVGHEPASWRMPNTKQMETLARGQARMTGSLTAPPPWWQSVLADPRAAGKPWVRIEQRRLSEVPREVLRVECLRCFRLVEIRKADAIRLCGPHATWIDVAQRLLDVRVPNIVQPP
jgi:hypothetical protein